MKNFFILLTLITMSCSHLNQRRPASWDEKSYQFKFQLSANPIFASGADSAVLGIKLFSDGDVISIRPSELEILTDVEVQKSKFAESGGMSVVTLTPKLHSPKIRFMVVWKGEVFSEIQELDTTQVPLKDKMAPIARYGVGSQTVNGLSYQSNQNFTPGLYEGFSISNYGNNQIVDTKKYPYSGRSYGFEFEEQVRQNIGLLVNDAPNEFTSHGMYSQFMFFPRKILPYAVASEEGVKVTLTNGEKINFSKDGVIKSGIFTEGPVDISGDRFKRIYPSLKYQGKGILLRANARGGMPQQGQFENTKIDMEYGIKYSAEVLIINGTTGQRCRRPKIDFWTNADVSPIPFKFPTDKEFDAYLKAKCGFGIPEMEIEETPKLESVEGIAQEIWGRCEKPREGESSQSSPLIVLKNQFIDPALKSCLDQELNSLPKNQQSPVAFDLFFIMDEARKSEKEGLWDYSNKVIPEMKTELLKDLSWVGDFSYATLEADCLKKVPKQSSSLRFHKAEDVLSAPMKSMCTSLKAEILPRVESDGDILYSKLTSDLSWIKSIPTVQKDCQAKIVSFVTSLQYGSTPKAYESSYASVCARVEKSEAYQSWLQENLGQLEEKVQQDSLIKLEEYAVKKADACLVDYPMNNAINKLRWKKARENCLLDSWEGIVEKAVKDSLIKPVSLLKMMEKIAPSERRIQIKILKDKLT